MGKPPEPDDNCDERPDTWRDFLWGIVIFLGILFFLIGW
jgi:hypothetical protein